MNTMENNKLIAEFMGIHEIMRDEYSNYEIDDIYPILGIEPHPHKFLIIHESDLQFHKSWDWLMPVLKKINLKLTPVTYSQWRMINRPTEYDISNVYYQAVEFIKWYNENKG